MATGNMLQGQARGKVGDIVFSVVKGQQVSRVYNAKPANPKTDSQIGQRVKLGAAVGFYKRNTQFFPFAFQKQGKESDYNAFIRENINVSPYISRQGVVGNQIIPAPYQMTRGNLPELTTNTPALVTSSINFTYTIQVPGIVEGNTVKDLREALGANIGDMITIYAVVSWVDSATSMIAQNGVVRCYAKFTFRAEDEAQVLDDMDWDEEYNTSGNSLLRSAGVLGIQSLLQLPATVTRDNVCSGFCAVLSRRVTGSPLQVSSSKMNLSTLAQSVYARYRSEAMLQEAKNSYGVQNDAFLSPSVPTPPQP